MSAPTTPETYVTAYRRTVEQAWAALQSNGERGLSEAEAPKRQENIARNELAAEDAVPAWRRFLAQFTVVLVVLLLMATAISAGLWWYERESALPYEAIAILSVVVLDAILGFVQESRAEAVVATLRAMPADDAAVKRDASSGAFPASEIVLGDLILIEEGDPLAGRIS